MDFYGTLFMKKINKENSNLLGANMSFKKCLEDSLTTITEDMLEGILNIRAYAFYGCDHLESVTIPSSISNINDSAFDGCESLESLTMISEIPPIIGTNVFRNTSNELKIYVPDGSVDAYKEASGWSEYASKIFPIVV